MADPETVLVEPARAQVIALAAEVLGRLPADEVPASLRVIARFAPAKRHRLGGAAIAAALDADDEFRAKVAEVLTEASPGLSAAVRNGTSTATADPIDIAVIAFLDRPDGWGDVLAEANRRWADERADGGAVQEELVRLRAELAELRAKLRGEPARLRQAAAAAADATDAELVALRRAARDRVRDLRTAERERDDARAAVVAGQVDRERSDAVHEGELRRLRARLAEAERAAEAARRGVRTERDVDDARLWLLVDTVVQAAAGIRRELSLAAPSVRPADAVASSAGPGGVRTATDAAGLDQLLALPDVHLIVDGYNVTKTGYPELPLAEQRVRLIGSLAAVAAQSGAEITIAFDGALRPPAQPVTPRGVRVLFSAADEIADDLIRRLVSAEPQGRPVIVVTSDRQVVTDTGRDGAWTVPSAVLLSRLN